MASALPLVVLASAFGLGAAQSEGSCYDSTTHVVTCNVDETTCTDASNYWYDPGYVGGSGCCHCDSMCDHTTETAESCTYYDAPSSDGSCYDSTTHAVTCDILEATCTATGASWYAAGYVGGGVA